MALSLSPSFRLTHFFFPLQLREEVGGLIKILLRERRREGKGEEGREMKGREEGVAKSIPQVNLRLEIFHTINKQGESGDGMRGRRGG